MHHSAKLALPALLGVVLALAGCGSEADRAAAPLPSALEALGLRNVSYAKVAKDGDTISLLDVRAQVDEGEVRASEVVVRGFKGTGSSWSAERVTGERVTGALAAERAVVIEPRATKASGAWTLTRSAAYADGAVRGRVLGTDVEARHLGLAPSSNPSKPGLAFEADGARPTRPVLASKEAWDVRATLRTDIPGKIVLDVSRAVSASASLGPALLVLEATPEAAAALSALDGPALADPSRWPGGVSLRSLEADLALAAAPSWLPVPGSAQDPAVASVLSSVAAAFAPASPASPKGSGLRVVMAPPRPVPVRDLAKALLGKDATARLGLVVTGEGIPGQPAGAPPFTMGAGTPPGTVPPAFAR